MIPKYRRNLRSLEGGVFNPLKQASPKQDLWLRTLSKSCLPTLSPPLRDLVLSKVQDAIEAFSMMDDVPIRNTKGPEFLDRYDGYSAASIQYFGLYAAAS